MKRQVLVYLDRDGVVVHRLDATSLVRQDGDATTQSGFEISLGHGSRGVTHAKTRVQRMLFLPRCW